MHALSNNSLASRTASLLLIPAALFFVFVSSAHDRSGAAPSPPTYCNSVAPILYKHCARCHRAGEIGSNVAILTYEGAAAHAQDIERAVTTGKMPPWGAEPGPGIQFRNDTRLSRDEIDTLVAWVKAGSPKGNESDLPPAPNFGDGWLHPHGRKPDLVLPLSKIVGVPASGEMPYVRLMTKIPFAGDRWIEASQTRPGTPLLVHHMAITELVVDRGTNAAELDQVAAIARRMGFGSAMFGARPAVTANDPDVFDMLGMYTPGGTFEQYPAGTAKLLKGGENMYLSFNMHYKTIGTAGDDRSMIAFWFTPDAPQHQIFRIPGAGETILANGKELLADTPGVKAEGTRVAIPAIQPHDENFELVGVTGYREPVTMYKFQPHAHHHGKDFTYSVVYPDGQQQIILKVPHFDHRWQMAYELEAPLHLPAGSKLVVTAHYENSMAHHDAASTQPVFFREQNTSMDEMFSPFLDLSFDNQDPRKPASASATAGAQLLPIAEVVGCLEEAGRGNWSLSQASDPQWSQTQFTTAEALHRAASTPLEARRYRLLGPDVFLTSVAKGAKVAVKGIWLADASNNKINVTSLQQLSTSCARP